MRRSFFVALFLAVLGLSYVARGAESIVFLGDTGLGDGGQYLVGSRMHSYCAGEGKCGYALLLGDNFYPRGISDIEDPQLQTKFELPYKDLPIPFWAVLGNHDYKGSIYAEIDYSARSAKWRMPSRYYKLSPSPELEIFMLDTEKFDSEQYVWLSEELRRSHAIFKICAGHSPVYSGGWHGDNYPPAGRVSPLAEKATFATFTKARSFVLFKWS